MEIGGMSTSAYNKKIFLSELESSMKEVKEKKSSKKDQPKQSSWRELFNTDKEQGFIVHYRE
jgi:hypothetical protein